MSSWQRRTAGRMALSLAGLVLLLVACYWTFRLAWASHISNDGSAQSLAAAVRFAPGDAALLTRYATVAPPDESARALERAAALNPGDSITWIQLGLSAEAKSDFDS